MQYEAGAKRPNLILPKGIYPARVTSAEEKTSKAGNPMLVVGLEIYADDKRKVLKDYITLGGEYSADWKLGHLVKSAGLEDDGNLDPALLIERLVNVRVKVKPAKGDFQEDNAIDDYVVPKEGDAPAAVATSDGPSGGLDEPPFAPFQKGWHA